jgi:putative transposase
MAPSKVVQYLKGRSSRLLREEFQDLKKRYWGQRLWSRGYFCAAVGSVTEEMIKQYIDNQEATTKDSFKIEE